MAEFEAARDRGRAIEAAYFHKKEQELIKKLQEQVAKEAERQGLAEEIGISDEIILKTLEELGFSRDLVKVFHFFPLIAVAWADGEVSEKEKDLIFDAAKVWKIEEGTPPYAKLQSWLTERPDPVYQDQILRILKDIENLRTDEKQETFEMNVVSLCRRVAEASGGFLGFGNKVSKEEEEVLDRMARMFAAEHKESGEKLLLP
jgi:hypothetical protein